MSPDCTARLIGTATLTAQACALRPGTGGVFEVQVDGATVWSRKAEGRFPDIKELKQRVRDRIAPDKPLGHSDKPVD